MTRKKEERRAGNIKVFSCKIRCCALSLGVEVGGFFNLVWGLRLGLGCFFFFLSPLFSLACNSSFQTEARAGWFETQLQTHCRSLSLPLFGALGSNHFEDHKSHIVEASPPAFVDGLHFRSASLPACLPPVLCSRRDGKGGVTWLDPFPASQLPAGAALALQKRGGRGNSCGV